MKTQRFLRPPLTHPQADQGAVEPWIALPVPFLLLGATLQSGNVLIAKNTFDYAPFRGVRAATTFDHGSRRALQIGFAEGHHPLFSSGSGMAYDQALAKALIRVNNPLDLQVQKILASRLILRVTRHGPAKHPASSQSAQGVGQLLPSPLGPRCERGHRQAANRQVRHHPRLGDVLLPVRWRSHRCRRHPAYAVDPVSPGPRERHGAGPGPGRPYPTPASQIRQLGRTRAIAGTPSSGSRIRVGTAPGVGG